jgi:hypothetical protein
MDEILLKHGTEDSLMIGTDYSHADQSAEVLRAMGDLLQCPRING